MQTYIHSQSGILNHDSSVTAAEDEHALDNAVWRKRMFCYSVKCGYLLIVEL
jgi:hypothetical protein